MALVLVAWSGSPAEAQTRVALVIGNSAYQSLKALKNPANDAADVATALKLLGFKVHKGIDLKRPEMLALFQRFQDDAKTADAAIFYYAGHGFQVSQKNYLVPVDARIQTAQDVATQTIDLSTLTAGLENNRSNRLVFLDACRNNPLRGPGGADVQQGARDGLARLGSAAGFLYAYATQPDNIAFDGVGRNSPFAQAFLNHLNTRGQDVNAMMIEVRKDVMATTGGYQVPWENSSLTAQFQFAPGQPAAVSPETQLWQLAATSRDHGLLDVYLKRYPEGAHATEARSFLKVASADPEISPVRSTSDVDRLSDDRLWDFAQRARIRALVEFYVARRPDGRHVNEARELLESLPTAEDADRSPEVVCKRSATHPRDATANTPGVPLADLARNADDAIAACRAAWAANPDVVHYAALLARALAASGERGEAVGLYRVAAERGDLRAMVSLGLILDTGDGAPRDPKQAIALYERAAAAGSADGAINMAVALMEGNGVRRDPARAIALLRKAAAAGSAIATYNLGVLSQSGAYKGETSALRYFLKATELGDARGFVPAAILLDEGRGVAKDPAEAAEMLLRGAASDTGEAIGQLVRSSKNWSAETIRAVQGKLHRAGYYQGAIDGRGGEKLAKPLQRWRQTGSLALQ